MDSVTYDIAVIGPSHSGKTTLIRSYLSNDPKGTTSGYSSSKTISLSTKNFVLRIYDEPSVDPKSCDYKAPSLQKRNAILICFSVYDRKSFEEAGEYIKLALLNTGRNVFYMLVGTHCHVKENKEESFYAKEQVKKTEGKEEKTRQISYDEGHAFALNLKWPYIETNARENMKVEEAFETVLKEMMVRFPSVKPFTANRPPQKPLNRKIVPEEKSCSIF